MKKFFMLTTLAVASLTANAQLWIGGSAGFSTTSVENSDNTQNVFTIAPEVGYSINDKWDVALAIGFKHDNACMSSENTFEIKPYARYNCYKAGAFSVFCDGYVGFSTTHISGDDDNTNAVAIGITPGIGYDISKKVTLVAHIGDLSYVHGWKGDTNTNTFNLGVSNNISFGAYVKL